jgi:hypothetical protein
MSGGICEMRWPDELYAFGDDYWPTCRCCGAEAQLVSPLVAIDEKIALA